MAVKRKLKFTKRFYFLITAVVAVIAAAVVLLILGGSEGMTVQDTITLEHPSQAVIIRDEVTYTTERFERITYAAKEGDRVETGAPIATIYKWGYNDDILQTLLNTQKKIYDEQMSLQQDIANPELDAVNAEIQVILANIRAAVTGKSQDDLLDLELRLKNSLKSRGDILKSKVQASAKLTELYAEEQNNIQRLGQWQGSIAAQSAGRVSFYFDGYELMLSADKLSTVNPDLINTAIKGGGITGAVNITENQLYRQTNTAHWYVAFVTSSSAPFRVVKGETYQFEIAGYTGTYFSGIALEPVITESGVVNIIELNQEMGELVDIRVIGIKLKKEAQGVSVPIAVIQIKEGMPGINIGPKGAESWVSVDVLAQDEKYAVVRARDPGETVAPGQRYVKP